MVKGGLRVQVKGVPMGFRFSFKISWERFEICVIINTFADP